MLGVSAVSEFLSGLVVYRCISVHAYNIILSQLRKRCCASSQGEEGAESAYLVLVVSKVCKDMGKRVCSGSPLLF